MMLLIGLCIIPLILLITKRLSSIKIKKAEKILLNFSMLLISITFIILCFVVDKEPFNPEINEASEYILYSAIIYLFTPFLWIVTIYYVRNILKNIRIKKNSKIKKDEEYIYYRETLNKVSPGIVMFTSMFDVDFKKSISATILKLKLTDYIREKNGTFDYYGRMIYDLDGKKRMSYNYNEIRADKVEYSVVRKALILNFLVPISIAFCIVWTIISIYRIIEQIIYINKNYKRTLKGNELLNKAYSLKNYLKDYSLIKNKKEEEIILWEYYLVYAVILDVNVKIQDDIIQKYIK